MIEFSRVLEAQTGSGSGNGDGGGFSSGYANECHFDADPGGANINEDLIGSICKGWGSPASGGAVARIVLHDVGSHVGVSRLRGAVTQHRLAPVELMVAKGGHIVAHRVVGCNGRHALTPGSKAGCPAFRRPRQPTERCGAHAGAHAINDGCGACHARVTAGCVPVDHGSRWCAKW